MSALIDDYLRQVGEALRTDDTRKRAILDELRSHLEEKVRDLRADRPGEDESEIIHEVLVDFGDPRELALAYGPGGAAVLKNQAGEIVLRLGHAAARGAQYVATDLGPRAARAVGRGSGKFLKVLGVTLVVLLVLTLSLGIWAFYELRPLALTIAEEVEPTYQYRESCPTPCEHAIAPQVFYVKPEAQLVKFDLDIEAHHAYTDRHGWQHASAGRVLVVVTDPDGTERYNRTINASASGDHHVQTTWAAVPGEWEVRYEYFGFQGDVRLDAYARSLRLPWDGA